MDTTTIGGLRLSRLLLGSNPFSGFSHQWLAQTCPEVGDSEACVRRAARGGAVACHIHGGVMDHLVARGHGGEAASAIALIWSMGMKAGIAGHVPAVFEWAEKHLDVRLFETHVVAAEVRG